jgi:ribosomal protein S18 acetylase RimI-like enzyme
MIEIVSLPVEDWEAYRALRLRGLKEDPQAFGMSYEESVTFPPDRWQARLREAGTTGRNWLYFAKDGEQLVGMIGAYVDEDDPPEQARIVAMYVIPERRGEGIAARLMRAVLDALAAAGLHSVSLQVNQVQKAAIKLYQRCGFRIESEAQFTTGSGEIADIYVMMREL